MLIIKRSMTILTLLCFLTVQITFFATPSQATTDSEHCAYTTLISGEKKAYLGNIHLAAEDVGLSCYNAGHELVSTDKFFDGSDVGLEGVNITGVDLSPSGVLLFTVDQAISLYNPRTQTSHYIGPNHIFSFTFAADSTPGDTKGHFRKVGEIPRLQTVVALTLVVWNRDKALQIITEDHQGIKHLFSQRLDNGRVFDNQWNKGPNFSQSPVFQALNSIDVSTLFIDNKVIPMVTLMDIDDSACQREPEREIATTQDFIAHVNKLPSICQDMVEVQGYIGAEAMFALGLPAYLPATLNEPLDGRGTLLAHHSEHFYIRMELAGISLMLAGFVMIFGAILLPSTPMGRFIFGGLGFALLIASTIVFMMGAMVAEGDEDAAINSSPFPKLTKKIMSINPVDDFVHTKTEPIDTSAFALILSDDVKMHLEHGG